VLPPDQLERCNLAPPSRRSNAEWTYLVGEQETGRAALNIAVSSSTSAQSDAGCGSRTGGYGSAGSAGARPDPTRGVATGNRIQVVIREGARTLVFGEHILHFIRSEIESSCLRLFQDRIGVARAEELLTKTLIVDEFIVKGLGCLYGHVVSILSAKP
jgi:hypothetical protein